MAHSKSAFGNMPANRTLHCNITASISLAVAALFTQPAAATEIDVNIHYLKLQQERPKVLSSLVTWPEDNGEQGARLGIADNNTTGRFLKHRYALNAQVLDAGTDPLPIARKMLANGSHIAVLDLPADILLQVAALPEAADDLLFNAARTETALRSTQCMANVLHTVPSRAMMADALMQFLVKRKWNKLFLIEGNRTGDKAMAQALRQSANKFRLKLVAEKQWLADADIRRTASNELPVFTQAKSYDVVLLADEARDFSPFVQYNTWLPRPVVGSAGLRAVAWDRVVEQWGARQLQSRFTKAAARTMTGLDYAAWAAVRAIGEAVTRQKDADPKTVKQYLLSGEFSLGGFKRTKLTFRTWNGQLRQAIPLVSSDAVVAMAPIEGFLHKKTELDTLGLDEREAKCDSF